MTTKASNQASANRRRIFFNLYSQKQVIETSTIKKSDNSDAQKPVCFWTDEQYVSER